MSTPRIPFATHMRDCDDCGEVFDPEEEGHRDEAGDQCDHCRDVYYASLEVQFGRPPRSYLEGITDSGGNLTEKGKQELRDAGRGHLVRE